MKWVKLSYNTLSLSPLAAFLLYVIYIINVKFINKVELSANEPYSLGADEGSTIIKFIVDNTIYTILLWTFISVFFIFTSYKKEVLTKQNSTLFFIGLFLYLYIIFIDPSYSD